MFKRTAGKLLFVSLFLSAGLVWGAETPLVDSLLIHPASSEGLPHSADPDVLSLSYSPHEIEIHDSELKLDVEKLKAEVPRSSPLHKLTPEEQEKFFLKKNAFLNKVESFLKWLHLSSGAVGSTLKKIDNIFYEKALQIAKANAYGGTVLLHTHLGLGLSQKLLKRLQKSFGSDSKFTGRGGFILMLGLGLSLTKVEIKGQVKWVFEVFANYNRLIKVRSFLAEAGVGLGAYAHSQYRQEFYDFEKLLTVKVQGAAGQIRENSRMLQAGQSLTLAMPPLAGMAMLYTMQERRWSLLQFSWASSGGRGMCRQVFN